MIDEMRPLTKPERMYTYKQSDQISAQTWLIGYLRADMEKDGNAFFSSWNTFREDLRTPEFLSELNEVVNSMRMGNGLLSSRENLKAICQSMEGAAFGNDLGDYGVRVDRQKYGFLLRLNPRPEMDNLYCYCYERKWLDNHLKRAEKGIRFIDPSYKELFRVPDGDTVRITTSTDEILDRTCRYIDDYHVEVGQHLYHICEFAELMERNGNTVIPLRSSLPEHCYAYLPTTQEIGIVRKGESGYYHSDLSPVYGQDGKVFVEELNRQGGVTKAQAEAMIAGSMFGWGCPAADPANYDENGTLLKAKHRDRGDAR